MLRGGYGRYYDFAYTNANILFAVIGAQSSFGAIYSNNDTAGIKNADGTLFQVGQPLPPNELANAAAPLPSHAASPRIKQPYQTRPTSASPGRSARASRSSSRASTRRAAISAPGRTSTCASTAAPAASWAILPTTGNANFRIDTSAGVSHYKGATVSIKKRWDGNLQLLGWYTLSSASSSTSLRATDEFGEYNVLDMFDPYKDEQEAPTRSDSRHRFTVSGTWSPGAGFYISPIFRYKSKAPYNVITGVDANRDGTTTNDLPAGVTSYNSARGAEFKQFDLRASKKFNLGSRARMEVIGEIFNLFNAENPGGFVANHERRATSVSRRSTPATSSAASSASARSAYGSSSDPGGARGGGKPPRCSPTVGCSVVFRLFVFVPVRGGEATPRPFSFQPCRTRIAQG